MSSNSNIINWENVFKQSDNFKNQKPFSFAFIEDVFNGDFYKKLYETYPKIDETWHIATQLEKTQFAKYWRNTSPTKPVEKGEDKKFSSEWNEFKKYAESEEFIENFRKFSGVTVNRLKYFHFMSYKQGGFQFPHIHNVGPNTIIMMVYFTKGWGKGEPGGTYMASETDESKIIFEPHNLDNSLALFHDGPKAAHGVRYISKDVERQALQITLEKYSDETGWSGEN
jgi:hypothetical protein